VGSTLKHELNIKHKKEFFNLIDTDDSQKTTAQQFAEAMSSV
jgi:hypothetical protein